MWEATLTPLDSQEFAHVLMSKDRKSWQDVDSILEQIGVEKGKVVADLACGPGYFTIPLSKGVGSDGIVYAVDRNEVMIKNLKQNLYSYASETKQNVNVIESDIYSTSIPAHSCNLVFFANVLHDIEDTTVFFKEVKRIAKNDAHIVNIDWHKRDMQLGPPLAIRLSESQARHLLISNGFLVSHAVNAGPYHYGLVCKIKE